MAHDDVIKRNARKAFVFQRQSLPTIAIALTVSEATLRRWKREAKERGDDWDMGRAANTIAGEGMEAIVASVIEDFVVLYQSTIEGLKGDPAIGAADRVKMMASLADAFHKMISASGRVSPKISELGVAMDVLKRLADFIRKTHPDQAGAFLEVLEPFGGAPVGGVWAVTTLARFSAHSFREAVTGLQDQLRRRIEAEVDGFPADDAARRERIARVKHPVSGYRFFVETYFPHYIKAAPNLLHQHLFERLPVMISESRPGRRGARLVEMAPRGSAKSTMVTQLFSLWCALIGAKKFIIIGMDAYEQAALMLEAIKIELEDNPRLQMDFPEVCGQGRVWREGEMVTRNGVRFQGVGSRQKVRGRRHGPHRPDLVLLDDIENDENVRSPEFRQKLETWVLKAVEPLGPADGSMDLIVLGTLLHFDAVLKRLGQRPGWELHVWKAVMEFPANMHLWDEFGEIALNDGEDAAVVFYRTNRAAMDDGAVLFWPEVKPLVALMYKRATSEDSFQSEDQNDPVADGSPFKAIKFWVSRLSNWMFFGAVDPSLGKHGKSRDPSAILVGGFDRTTGILDVVEASIRKRLPDVICEDTIAMQREWNCVLWGIESVQFQEFLRTEIMVRAVKQGVTLPATPLLPIADKALRIERLQPPIASGLIRLHIGQKTLIEQLQQWPNAAHDDGPDCLEMLWMVAVRHGAGGLNAGMVGATQGRGPSNLTQGYRL